MNMEEKPQLEQSTQEEQIRTALNAHWSGDAEDTPVVAAARMIEFLARGGL
jgi:hypothetical protein